MIFIEKYKGYEIIFDNKNSQFFFNHEILGKITGIALNWIKDDIDKYSDVNFISPVKIYDIRDAEKYAYIYGFNKDNNPLVKYDSGAIQIMSSSALRNYITSEYLVNLKELEELRNRISDINKEIESINNGLTLASSLIPKRPN